MTVEVIVLAAGQGTRMRSKLPKVLHCVAGKPMLQHVIDTASKLSAEAIHVVVGHGAEQVKEQLANKAINWVIQQQQLGTGHAVAQAMPHIRDTSIVLVAYGDVPLVSAETLGALLSSCDEHTLSLLTVKLSDPGGYGRIVRVDDKITEIVEQKDAHPEQLLIDEVNTGILAVSASKLNQWLPTLSANNAQQEYYLTDIIAMAVAEGMTVTAHHPATAMEVEGANNRAQIAALERFYQSQQAAKLMADGATIADPARIDVRGDLSVGSDVFIDINCLFIGKVTLGDNVTIGPNCVIEDSSVGTGSVIKANSVLEQARVASDCDVGPYARLRPGTVLADRAKIGNFVETKKADIGEGSKVNHLSYIGDSHLGSNVNIGAGTITCNYDGANKFQTNIGNDVFVGSNSALVAPLTIDEKATIGAGSTITGDVKAQQLSIARTKQRNIDSWKRPTKKKP